MTLIAVSGIMIVSKSIEKKQNVYINEVRSWDADVTRSGYYGSDYIELYNSSNNDINLEGYYLSDELTSSKKWQFPNLIIKSKGRIKINNEKYYLKEFYEAERYIADKLCFLNDMKVRSLPKLEEKLESLEEKNNISYDEIQKKAIKTNVFGKNIKFLSGCYGKNEREK